MDDPKRDDARLARAERAFKAKEEGAQAMWDYEAEARAVREKTVRLKAQRLAKEAEDEAADAKKKPLISPTKKTTKPRERPSSKKRVAKAAKMAGQEIDRLGDRPAAQEQQASRKRRLLKGPKEFRDIRGDQGKRKR